MNDAVLSYRCTHHTTRMVVLSSIYSSQLGYRRLRFATVLLATSVAISAFYNILITLWKRQPTMHHMDEVSDFVDHVMLANYDVVEESLRPPEFTPEQGTSLKGHLYSLAHTLDEATRYGQLDDDDDAELSKALVGFIHWLSEEDPAQRPDIAEVVAVCDRNLRDPSGVLCQRLSSTVNGDLHQEQRRSLSSSQVLFPRRHSLSNSMSLESLCPGDIFNTKTSSASPSLPESPGPAVRCVTMMDERGSSEPLTGEPLGEASTAADLNLSGAQTKYHSLREKQFVSGVTANFTKRQVVEGKRYSLMRRVNTLASKGFSCSGNSVDNKNSDPALSPQNSLCVHKSLVCEIPSITVSCARTENDTLSSLNSIQVSESLDRHRKSQAETLGASQNSEFSEQSLHPMGIKTEAAIEFSCENGDEFSGSLEPLSPLCTDDLSILEGNMVLDDPWLEDEDTEPDGHLELKQPFQSNPNTKSLFQSLELPSSAFDTSRHSFSGQKTNVNSSYSCLNDATEERSKGALTSLDIAARGMGQKAERVSGTDLAHTSTRHLSKPQDFFDNRRASDSQVSTSVTYSCLEDAPSRAITLGKSSTSSTGVQEAKAKAKAAMETIKMDLKAPKPELPPTDMLESLEKDALIMSAGLSATDSKQPSRNPLETTNSIVKDNSQLLPASEITVSAHETLDKWPRNKTVLAETTENDKLLDARGLPVLPDQEKCSFELEHTVLNCSSHNNQGHFSQDSSSSIGNRVQKVKVTVVQGSPISRASAFSPIQKPKKALEKLASKREMRSVPLISAFQQVKKDVAGDQDEPSDLRNQSHTVPTTQLLPAFVPVPQIHDPMLGHKSHLRLRNPQTLHLNVGSAVGHVQDVPSTSSRSIVPKLPLKIQLQQDPSTGLFHVLPVDLNSSPVTLQGSTVTVVSQESPVVSQRSPVVSQESPVVSQESPVVSQRSPVVSQRSPVVSQRSPVVSQESPVVSQESPVVSQESPVVSQRLPVVSQRSPVVSQRSPVVSQGSPFISQGSPAVSQRSPVVSQGSPAVSQRSPVILQGLSLISNGPSILSEGSFISRNSSVVPQDSSAVSQDFSAFSQEPSAISRDSSAVSQDSSAVSQDSSVISQDSSAVSQGSSAISRGSSAVSQGSSAVSQGSSAVSRDPSAVSQDPSAVSQDPSAVSQDPSAVSQDPSAILRGSSAVSQGSSAVSQGSSIVSQGSSAVSQDSSAISRGSSVSSQGSSVGVSSSDQGPTVAASGKSSVATSAGFQAVNSSTSVSQKTSAPVNIGGSSNSQSRQKSPGVSSNGNTSYTPVTLEILQRDTAKLKREQMKKCHNKTKQLLSTSKRSLPNTTNRASESESSDSPYFETLSTRNSPKVLYKKASKTTSANNNPDHVLEKTPPHSTSQNLNGLDKLHDSKTHVKTLKQLTPLHSIQNGDDSAENYSKTSEKPRNKPHNNTRNRISHKPKDRHSKRPNLTTDDIDDTRPLGSSARRASSPFSSSLSRDSGVNLHYSISSGDELTTLSEVHLADALQGNDTLRKVIKLIRQAFAYDGYLENGVEDLAMAEYITSLSKLTWLTFTNAISEKFFDLYWEEVLLEDLFQAVNGRKHPSPVIEASKKPRLEAPQKPPRTKSSRPSLSSTTHLKTTSPTVKKTRNNDANSHDEESSKTSAVTESKTRSELDQRIKKTQDEGRSCETGITSGRRNRSKQTEKTTHVLEDKDDVKSVAVSKPLRSETCVSDGKTNSSPARRYKTRKECSKEEALCSPSKDSPKLVENPSGEFQLGTDRKISTQTGERNGRQKQQTEAVFMESKRTSNQDSRLGNARGDLTSQPVLDPLKNGSLGVINGMPNLQKPEREFSKRRICEIKQNSKENFDHMIGPQDTSSADLTESKTGSTCDLTSPNLDNTSSNHGSYSLDSTSSSLSRKSSESSETNQKIQELLTKRITHRDSRGSLSSISSSNSCSYLNSDSISLPSMSSLSGSLDESRPGLANSAMYRGDGIDPSVEAYTQHLAGPGGTQQNIDAKIADIDQQLMLEKRMRTKTEKFYHKLLHNQPTKGADNKSMVAKVGKQIVEMSKRIDFLESSKRYLEMLYAEQWGLDLCYLYVLAVSSDKTALDLQPTEDNPLLAFHTSRTKVSLQAGQPAGLFSFLYARQALVQGYLHHFFYTYRYYTTSQELFHFIADTFISALGMSDRNSENRGKIICRTLDILQVWIEGSFEVDFRHNVQLLHDILDFISVKISPVDSNGQCLVQLIEKQQQDQPGTSLLVASHEANMQDPLIPANLSAFTSKVSKGQTRSGVSGRVSLKANIMSCILKKDLSKYSETAYLPAVSMETDGFSLSDHTSLGLAHQLTLLQQELFHRIHPVQYLDSRSKGIGVKTNNYDMTGGKGYTQSGGDVTPGLFVSPLVGDGMVRVLLDHARDVSHWVSAEIVSCSLNKTQLALLCKFINVAKACYDLRNFATCVQILDSLESLIVRQLPVWRNLPTKVASLYEELHASKITLQGDSEVLTRDDTHKGTSTLPATLLFLIHVQQLEIGSFTLANGMYKWTKLKSIAKFVDQIRVFQEHAYSFYCDHELQGLLQRRILECCDQDIHVLAARHSSNYHRLPLDRSSSRRLQNALQKVRATLH